jgi:cell division septum initiation protein DivIVA
MSDNHNIIDNITDPEEMRAYLGRLELSMEAVKRRLRRFEDEFGMDSEAFYAKLQNAQLDERFEYAEWAGEHEMLKRLSKQKQELEERLSGKG